VRLFYYTRFPGKSFKQKSLRTQTIGTALEKNRNAVDASMLPTIKALETVDKFVSAVLQNNANWNITKL